MLSNVLIAQSIRAEVTTLTINYIVKNHPSSFCIATLDCSNRTIQHTWLPDSDYYIYSTSYIADVNLQNVTTLLE